MAEGNQLSLLSDAELELVTDQALERAEYAQGVYSGVDFKRNNPERYALIVQMLAEGISQKRISSIVKCSRNLVAGINKMQAADIEHVKRKLAASASNLAGLMIERATEMVLDPTAKVSLHDLTIGAAVMVDKSQVLTGGATVIVGELKPAGPSHADFEAFLSGLPAADVHEVNPMGLAAEISAPKGGGLVIDEGDLMADKAPVSAVKDGVR